MEVSWVGFYAVVVRVCEEKLFCPQANSDIILFSIQVGVNVLCILL